MNVKGYCGTEYDLIFSESWNINRINLKRPKNKIKLYDWKEFQKQAKLNINILKERIAGSQLSTPNCMFSACSLPSHGGILLFLPWNSTDNVQPRTCHRHKCWDVIILFYSGYKISKNLTNVLWEEMRGIAHNSVYIRFASLVCLT